MLLKRSRRARASDIIIAALDIGTHKICCLIGSIEEARGSDGQAGPVVRTLGLGHQRSHGIESGAVVDLGLAQAAVSSAVAQAEQAAGVQIDRVHLGVTCGAPASRTFNGYVELAKGVVGEDDVARLDAGAHDFAGRDGRHVLTINRIAFGLDASLAIREPRGLVGRRLTANHHAVTVEPGPLRNLRMLVENCQLGVASLLPAAYASAIAATTDEERRLGVTCVDIGAGVTSLASFADGHLVHCAAIPLGGQQVTRDIAHALTIPLAEAERIKTLYGSLATSASDDYDVVHVDRIREDGGVHSVDRPATKGEIGRLIARPVGALLASVRSSLSECGIERIRGATVVLTGGASELMGLEAWATSRLGRRVRISSSTRIDGVAGRGFSCVAGLAASACLPSPWLQPAGGRVRERQDYLGRVEQWLRESF